MPAATLVLLRDAAAGPEALLLRRSRVTRFAPGFYVFPGGRVDPSDGGKALADLWNGLEPGTARARLGLDPGATPSALAYYGAAVRETFEETGVVACAAVEGAAVEGEPFSAARESLLNGVESFSRVLRRLRLRLDGAALEYVAHWVTPAASARRYDTRFFATAVPPGVRVTADEREIVHAAWLSPRTALARHRAGDLPLMRPTRRTLEEFQAFSSVDALLAAYRGRAVSRIEPNPGL